MDNYFEIKNLKCSYNRNDKLPKVVLEIDELKIPKGELVFIVGQSGCGKSTILETLGLMNNAMLIDANTVFNFYSADDNTIDYLTIWKKSNKLISDIRLNHFSFIFQQTNLMRNFNIYENIAVTRMLQGASETDCKRVTNKILRNIGLDDFITMNGGAWDKNSKVFDHAHKASGGQQQRIAFARAMVSNFNILFCDEPTGNLDSQTADDIMKHLYENIKNQENATAIIVSHDLTLAMKYGDRIVKIHKEKRITKNKRGEDIEEQYGHINGDSIFIKVKEEHWTLNNTDLLNDEIHEKLRN
jgi:ABC-type lipoprotein export system ATPase subunit